MSKILLSDWTLVAFKQREEERRKREQGETAPLPPATATPRANETLRSEWTIAVLQKRFAALEQRLAAQEQREEARRQSELREAAARTRQQEEHDKALLATSTIVALQKSFAALEQRLAALEQREEARRQSELEAAAARIRQKEEQEQALLAPPAIVAPSQGNERWRGIDQPGLLQPEFEPREAGLLAHADAQWLERNVSETARDREGKGDRIEIRPARKGGIVVAIFYRVVSIMITASIAAAIGFGIGVYAVPIEKAAQFHSFVNRALHGVSLPKKH